MNSLKKLWCRLMHGEPMYAGGAEWECPDCRKRYRVAWAPEQPEPEPKRGFGALEATECL